MKNGEEKEEAILSNARKEESENVLTPTKSDRGYNRWEKIGSYSYRMHQWRDGTICKALYEWLDNAYEIRYRNTT